DSANDIGARERLALEMAATLDRAASSATTAEARRARWAEATEILDRFSARNPGHLQARAFQVQAAVYVWARARSWMQVYKDNPLDGPSRDHAVAELERCVNRLKPLVQSLGDANDVLAQNARFRLA